MLFNQQSAAFLATLVLIAAAACHATCDVALKDKSCTLVPLHSLDSSLSTHQSNFAFAARSLQVSTSVDGSISLHLPQQCDYKALLPAYEGKQMAHFNVTTERVSKCKLQQGTWFLATDKGHSQQNVFEELSLSWYPAFLASRRVCSLEKSSMRITHLASAP